MFGSPELIFQKTDLQYSIRYLDLQQRNINNVLTKCAEADTLPVYCFPATLWYKVRAKAVASRAILI